MIGGRKLPVGNTGAATLYVVADVKHNTCEEVKYKRKAYS